jgi:hypothetical protein
MDIGEKIGTTLLTIAVLIVMTLGVIAITADHSTQRYYVGESGRGFVVMGQILWQPDDTVFTTDDIEKAVRICSALNDGMKK